MEFTGIEQENILTVERLFEKIDIQASASAEDITERDGLDIPVGIRDEDGEIQNIVLKSSLCISSVVVAGSTGTGKTNLLNTILLSACYKYSPEELEVYILDFNQYHSGYDLYRDCHLPHLSLFKPCLDKNPFDLLDVIKGFEDEMIRRVQAFNEGGVRHDFDSYIRAGNKMKRILVIVDAIEELFRNEQVAYEAADLLRNIINRARLTGIYFVLSFEDLICVPRMKMKVIAGLCARVSLQLADPYDACVLMLNPDSVKELDGIAAAVINDTRYGRECIKFRTAYAHHTERRAELALQIAEKWRKI